MPGAERVANKQISGKSFACFFPTHGQEADPSKSPSPPPLPLLPWARRCGQVNEHNLFTLQIRQAGTRLPGPRTLLGNPVRFQH